jgi:acyl carrier protein
MRHFLSMISPDDAQKHIKEILIGFPPHVIAAYAAFAEKGDAVNLDAVVLGVLHFYLAKKPLGTLDTLSGTTRLIEDLGCDSMTMLDTVFMVETLFNIKIDDSALTQLTTLDELKNYLREAVKVSATPLARTKLSGHD